MHILAFSIFSTSAVQVIAGDILGVAWQECNGVSTLGKITDLSPRTATMGNTTKFVFSGDFDTDITDDGVFTLGMEYAVHIPFFDCQGDVSVESNCNLPYGGGQLTFHPASFPIKAGYHDFKLDLDLSPHVPTWMLKTTTLITSESKSGEKIFCVEVFVSESNSLSYGNCGGQTYVANITAMESSSIFPGKTTQIILTAKLDKAVVDGTFEVKTFSSGATLLDCVGDAAQSKTCNLPGNIGYVKFDSLTFPIKKGHSSNAVSAEVYLNPLLPAPLVQIGGTLVASTKPHWWKSEETIFCIEVFTSALLNSPPSTGSSIVIAV